MSAIALTKIAGMSAGVLLAVCSAPHAFGQTPDLAAMQIKVAQSRVVVDAKGQLVAPWKDKEVCPEKESKVGCIRAIANMETGEIARLGTQWSTAFEPSGNGYEIARRVARAKPMEPGSPKR